MTDDAPMTTEVVLTVDRRDVDGALQVAINCGRVGFRIAGPKYDGAGRTLLRKRLTKRDAQEIAYYLKKIKADAD